MGDTAVDRRDVRRLVENARFFALALDGDELDRADALRELEASASRWVAGPGGLLGFDADGAPAESMRPEDVVDAAMADLDVGGLLLAAGVSADEVHGAGGGRDLLDDSIDRVDSDVLTAAPAPEVLGFAGPADEAAALDLDPRAAFERGVDRIVASTLGVLTQIWQQVRSMAPDVVTNALSATRDLIAAVPQVGRLVRLGLQALRRGVLALLALVPEPARDWARELTESLFGPGRASLPRTSVAAALDAETVQGAIDAFDWESLSPDAAVASRRRLAELVTRFEGIADGYSRLLRALAAAGSLTALFAALAPVAGWLTLASASGCLVLAGTVLVVARDHLDTERVLARVTGVRGILESAGRPS